MNLSSLRTSTLGGSALRCPPGTARPLRLAAPTQALFGGKKSVKGPSNPAEAAQLGNELLQASKRTKGGSAASLEATEDIEELCNDLKRLCMRSPASSDLLEGEWNLTYSSVPLQAGSKRTQIIEDGSVVDEVTLPGFLGGVVRQLGTVTASGDSLKFTFTEGERTEGFGKPYEVDLGPDAVRAFKVLFLDDRLRVVRETTSGTLYVYQRAGSSDRVKVPAGDAPAASGTQSAKRGAPEGTQVLKNKPKKGLFGFGSQSVEEEEEEEVEAPPSPKGSGTGFFGLGGRKTSGAATMAERSVARDAGSDKAAAAEERREAKAAAAAARKQAAADRKAEAAAARAAKQAAKQDRRTQSSGAGSSDREAAAAAKREAAEERKREAAEAKEAKRAAAEERKREAAEAKAAKQAEAQARKEAAAREKAQSNKGEIQEAIADLKATVSEATAAVREAKKELDDYSRGASKYIKAGDAADQRVERAESAVEALMEQLSEAQEAEKEAEAAVKEARSEKKELQRSAGIKSGPFSL